MAIKLGTWDTQEIKQGDTVKKFERIKVKDVWTPFCKSSTEKTKRL